MQLNNPIRPTRKPMYNAKTGPSQRYNTKKTLTSKANINDVLSEPYNFIFFGLLGFAVLCLVVLFFSLLAGKDGLGAFFGWLGVIAALVDLVVWLLRIFKII